MPRTRQPIQQGACQVLVKLENSSNFFLGENFEPVLSYEEISSAPETAVPPDETGGEEAILKSENGAFSLLRMSV